MPKTKGQIKPKADWHAVDSTKKRMNKFLFFFAMKSKKAKKQIGLFVFLGESAYCFILLETS